MCGAKFHISRRPNLLDPRSYKKYSPPVTESHIKSLLILSGLFVASLITANLIGSKLVLIGGFTLSAGILVIPVSFLVCDLISEMFGARIASFVVLVGLAVQLYALFFVELGALLPAAPRRDLTEAYNAMYSLTPRMVLASITAYTVSQLVDVRIFHFIKKKTGVRHLWLRKNVSTLAGQALDTCLFIIIFLGGVIPTHELLMAMIPPFVLKTLVAWTDTPFVYLGLKLLRHSPDNDSLTPQEMMTSP